MMKMRREQSGYGIKFQRFGSGSKMSDFKNLLRMVVLAISHCEYWLQ